MNQESQTDLVQRVNQLLRRSFGRNARGNKERISEHWAYFKDSDELHLITTWGFVKGRRVIGRFDSLDGSIMYVLPKYEEEAEHYVELYEKEFGSRPEICYKTLEEIKNQDLQSK